jgi:hypothetical protein
MLRCAIALHSHLVRLGFLAECRRILEIILGPIEDNMYVHRTGSSKLKRAGLIVAYTQTAMHARQVARKGTIAMPF